MTTLDTTRTQPHTSSYSNTNSRTTYGNTDIRDRWRTQAGLIDPSPTPSHSAGSRTSTLDFGLGFRPVASPTRVRI